MTKKPQTGRVHLARALLPVVRGHVERIAAVLAGAPDPGADETHPAMDGEDARRSLDYIWLAVYGFRVAYEQRMALTDLVHLAATNQDVADSDAVLAYWDGLWPEVAVDRALLDAAVAAWRAGDRTEQWKAVFHLLRRAGLAKGLARGDVSERDDPRWGQPKADGSGSIRLAPWDQLRIRYVEWRRTRDDDDARLDSFRTFLVATGRAP